MQWHPCPALWTRYHSRAARVDTESRRRRPPRGATRGRPGVTGLAGGLLKRILDFAERVFREREIILRSDVGVRYIVLTPTIQQIMAAGFAPAVVCVIWALIARQAAWRPVHPKHGEVARVEAAYRVAGESPGAAVDRGP